MGKKLTRKQRKVIEDLGWSISYGEYAHGDSCVELSQYSPLGEDFVFCVPVDDIKQAVIDYYQEFDPEEHAVELYNSGRAYEQSNGEHGLGGVPSSIRALLEDAEDIEKKLEQLAMEL